VQSVQTDDITEKLKVHNERRDQISTAWKLTMAAKNIAKKEWDDREAELQEKRRLKEAAEAQLKVIEASNSHAGFQEQLAAWETQRAAAQSALQASQHAATSSNAEYSEATVRLPRHPCLEGQRSACKVMSVLVYVAVPQAAALRLTTTHSRFRQLCPRCFGLSGCNATLCAHLGHLHAPGSACAGAADSCRTSVRSGERQRS
jgi:hypothetical protein